MIIVKRGTCPSSFALSNGHVVVLRPEPFLNIITDEIYEVLIREWGAFITPRICSDKNPKGCFVVQMTTASAQAQKKEMPEIDDVSSKIDGDRLQKDTETVAKALQEFKVEKAITTKKRKKK